MELAMADLKPDTSSSDYAAMLPFWTMVETILCGAAAMRAAGEKYLPRFPNETTDDYKYRRENAKFTNVYRDIVENLASKPFTKEVAVKDGSASDTIAGQQTKDQNGRPVRRGGLIEDIDGQGNHLHVFAMTMFFQGINDAIDWVLVDKIPVPDGASRAVEKDMGARPYWVHVPAKRMLAVYSAVIAGKEEFVHARIHEPETVKDGYGETTVNRVRVFDRAYIASNYGPATWELLEERKKANSDEKEWVSLGSGPISIGVIPIVPFITGRRKEGSWQFVPPMQDAAYLQVEHYQQETNLKSIKEQACFPMLAGNGVSPATDAAGNPVMVPVGPKSVLYAPPNADGNHGEWNFIEPSAESLKFLADDVKATEQQLRELGRQPLTAQTGNLTVVTTAFAAQKGNSAIQAWCLNLKDALEHALGLTCKWLNDSSEPEVTVHTDFAIDMESDKAPDFLLKLRETKDISRKAIITEAKRRDFLGPEYDEESDMEEILAEIPGDDDPDDLAGALPPAKKPPVAA
jgi:hypothetical protein